MQNLNYLFHVEYYSSLQHSNFKRCNERLFSQTFKKPQTSREAEPTPPQDSILLKVADYPGLLIGLGNLHAAGKLASGTDKDGTEIGLGFTLDYVTGLPYIPGSTVKGVLRSAFKYHPDYVYEILPDAIQKEVAQDAVWKQIGAKLFGDTDGRGGCVFFDAFPVDTAPSGKLFAMENITPHKAETPERDGLTDPIPLSLLKVIGGTQFLFRFDFSKIEVMNAPDLKAVFKQILLDLGIGAKTNVGFGGLVQGEGESSAALVYDRSDGNSQTGPVPTLGLCASCGKPTKLHSITKKPHKYCWECSQKKH